MEEPVEKFGSGRKLKRLNNKRQRGQVKNHLKGNRPEDFIDDFDDGKIDKNHIDESTLSNHLSFSDLPELDLIIRTSGETRVSNFMLWEMAYSEIHFTETLWPSFEDQEFFEILESYSQSERRFGSVEKETELKKA